MKIFISHSAKDRWAARRISDDLQNIGTELVNEGQENPCEVFLDEKTIETGASIDSAIREHLVDCDHFLILLSPASLRSTWVLLELGGALALDKVVVPILLYVGANEVPQAINLRLARDINDIPNYYDEIRRILSTQPVSKAVNAPPPSAVASKFNVGDHVRIAPKQPDSAIRAQGVTVSWVDGMNRYLGERAVVKEVDEDGDCSLDVDNGFWNWAYEWLTADKGN